jgi:hypothetical protein
MDGFLFVIGTLAITILWIVIFVRRAAKRNKIDPKAIEATRFTGDGGGWLYNDQWPRRRKKTDTDD